jgi:hypothetical protein
LFDTAAGLVTSDAGHEQVEQNAVHLLDGEHLQRLLAGVSEDHVIPFAGECLRQQVKIGGAVIDGQDLLRPCQAGRRPLFRRSSRGAQHGGHASQRDVQVFVFLDERVRAGVERA